MTSARTTKSGMVDKIISPPGKSGAEKAQISIEGAEPLYQEIRIENVLKDDSGEEVKLKEGAAVEVHIEAHKDSVEAKQK
jgi:hypothetical protein